MDIRKHKSAKISVDIGLAVCCAVRQEGETLSQKDIAEICECSRSLIFDIEKRALSKLKRNRTMKEINSENTPPIHRNLLQNYSINI